MKAHPAAGASSGALDDLLSRYAAGRLDPALHALVAGHLSLRDDNHRFVASLEASAAAVMTEAPPVALHDRDGMLLRVMAASERPVADNTGADALIPPMIAAHLGHADGAIPWRFMLPGVKRFGLRRDEYGLEAELLWIRAGRRMPSHTHGGSEYTLVLRGAFSDQSGRYGRGDIAIADEDVDHKPIADPDEDCICFAVTDAPLKLTGSVMGAFRRLVGY